MTLTVEAPVAAPASSSVTPRRWLGLFAVLMAILLNLLDASIVNVALPVIQTDIGGSYAALQWIAASYTLALAAGLLTGGRLGDMFGRKRMLLIGVTGFLVASMLCAFAVSPETLILARVLQGVFGAVMIPQGFGLIRDLFQGPEQAKAWGVVGPTIGLATILGPIVAGLLVKADLFGTGWRMIFAINLPLGLFTLIAGVKALPSSKGDRSGGLDVTGMLIAATGMSLLVYPLVQGREQGWPAWIFAMLAGSVVVLSGFVVHQLRRGAAGKTPLVQLSVFARRSYTSGVVFVIAFFIAIIGFSLALGFLLQLGLHYSPIGASLAMSSLAVGAFVGSAVGGMVAAKVGRRILHIGLVVMSVGMAGVYLVFRTAGVELGAWHLAAPLLVFGIGMGMIFVPLFDIIMGEVADREVGSAAGALESIQQLAAALGVAVLGTVFFNRFTAPGEPAANALAAAEQVTLIAGGLAVAAIVIGFFLPKKARATH